MPLLDRFGRPLRSLRISVTDRCNLRCQYCMPEPDYVWLPRESLLTFEETAAIVDAFTPFGVDRVRITGGEPLLRRDLSVLIGSLATRPALTDLAMTTNGVLLAAHASALRAAGLRFIEYMDVGGATRWTPAAVVSRREILDRLRAHYGAVMPIEEQSSAPADRFLLPDGTTFGVISSTTEPFCASCDRSRLTADGVWLLCLYAATGTDLRRPLRAGATREDLQRLIEAVWSVRADRGAEERLGMDRETTLIPVRSLKKDAHLEMHTRGG
jgi:molybdenum cofactor biosynthesis enzyme MoaA